jgi:hypothetical protein
MHEVLRDHPVSPFDGTTGMTEFDQVLPLNNPLLE